MPTKKQIKPIIISEEDFYSKYKPIINHIVRANTPESVPDNSICSYSGCMYETYGPEVAHIVRLANNKKTAKKVWTIIETDSDKIDNQVIIAGFHLVNRQGYIITEQPWVTGTEEVEND